MASALSPALPLFTSDLGELALSIIDVASVSGDEARLADALEVALGGVDHLSVQRDGNALVASTSRGCAERVIVAGHLDTVPIAANVPGRLEGEGAQRRLWGRGAVDMKGGLTAMVAAARDVSDPVRDVTWVFYDLEEVESARSGLGRIARNHPEWLRASFAVLCEPTAGGIEAGCNGTLRFDLRFRGVAAHSARAWMGHNAIHDAAPALAILAEYQPRTVRVDGLDYREGLNAVGIAGGIAGNVIPDSCTLTVNYRFAPDRSAAEAIGEMREAFAGMDLEITDQADGARPGLNAPAAQAFLDTVREMGGHAPTAKEGWTDVARFAALGVPAVNFGPGDPALAHHDDEACPVAEIESCHAGLVRWLT